MIVKMSKVYVVSRSGDRDRLLDVLRELGVVHLAPIDPAAAVAEEQTLAAIASLDRAMQILAGIAPAGEIPEISAIAAADETLRIHHESAERKGRLATLHRRLEQLDIWGDVTLEQFAQLCEAGIDVRFFAVPETEIGGIRGECVQVVGRLANKRLLAAVIDRSGEFEPPESAEALDLPDRDRPSIRAEAAKIDAALKKDAERLSQLAHLTATMRKDRNMLAEKADYTVAQRGGLDEANLFAVQGWTPQDQAETLADRLAAAGLAAAVRQLRPAENEEPPTLIRYPRWARPIKAVFDILGTNPGYRECDLSPFFMIALPLFTAMLIGDAGYGLLFTIIGLIFYRKISAKAGRPAAQLVVIFGLVTFTWGVLIANYFGVTPANLAQAGGFSSVWAMKAGSGFWAVCGRAMSAVGILWRPDSEAARSIVIKISFIIGCTHLVLAHLRKMLGLAPNLKALAEIGWCGFLLGMLGLIWMLFFPDGVLMPLSYMTGLLIGGAALIIMFSYPSRNPAKMLGLGLVANILPMIGAFSDTMSYIRLMAVGLASYYIASAFNGLAYQVCRSTLWLIPAAALIVVFAHLLNIALGLIAVFAHGVRLNMLEFSSNAGVQWFGYPYAPFAAAKTEGDD